LKLAARDLGKQIQIVSGIEFLGGDEPIRPVATAARDQQGCSVLTAGVGRCSANFLAKKCFVG
jgi:hypothetical protein